MFVRRQGRVIFFSLAVAALLTVCLVRSTATLGESGSALAPFQVVARGFEKPTGLVFHPQGHPEGFLVLSDRKTGVLYRLTQTDSGPFTSEVLFSGLDEPIGVAVDRHGHLHRPA